MTSKRICGSQNFAEDLIALILGISIGLIPFLDPRLYQSSDAVEILPWPSFIGIGFKALFLGSAFLVFNRIVEKGGAALVFISVYYTLQNYLPSGTIISHLNQVYLGLGFWALIVFSGFWIFEDRRYKRPTNKNIHRDKSSDDEPVVLHLNE